MAFRLPRPLYSSTVLALDSSTFSFSKNPFTLSISQFNTSNFPFLFLFARLAPSIMLSVQPCDKEFLTRLASTKKIASADDVRHTGSWIDTTDKRNQVLLTRPQFIAVNSKSSQEISRGPIGHKSGRNPQQQSCRTVETRDNASVATSTADDPQEHLLTKSSSLHACRKLRGNHGVERRN